MASDINLLKTCFLNILKNKNSYMINTKLAHFLLLAVVNEA